MANQQDFEAYYERLKTVLDEGVSLLGASALTGTVVTALLRLPEQWPEVTTNKIIGALFGGLSHNMTAGRVNVQAIFEAAERAEVDPGQVTQLLGVFTKLISVLASKRSA